MSKSESQGVRAAIYARVSTDEQAEHGTSLDDQVRRCEAYCQSQGWELVATFSEEGISGTKASRPELDRLLRSARRGELDAIVVAKLDRWGRSMRHLVTVLGELDDLSIRFASVAEAIDSSTASGRLLRNVLGAIAEFEREAIVERTSQGLRAIARGGWWPGGPPPFGYRIERHANRSRLAIDDQEAETIRCAVECLVDRGMTTWQTAIELSALGHRPRRSPRWTHDNLRQLLLDAHGLSGEWPYRRAKRRHRQASDEVVVEIPAILTPNRHHQLRQVLARTSSGPGATARKNAYLLVGRIHAPCGGSMQGIARNDRYSRAYRCINNRAEALDRCDCRRCEADALESAVWNEVLGLLTDPDRLHDLARTAMEAQPHGNAIHQDDLTVLDRRIAKLERGLGSTVADLVRKGMDGAAIQAASRELEADLARLRQHRTTIMAWRSAADDHADRMERLRTLATRAQDTLANPSAALQRRVLDLLDVHIHVTAWNTCSACAGRGLVPTGHKPRTQPHGSTGVACGTCHRYRTIPVIEIRGTIPDSLELEAGQPPTSSQPTYPFEIKAS